MDSYNEVRRVRKEMSARVGHDIRALIASINTQWPDEASHAVDPGTKAEQCDAHGVSDNAVSNGGSSPAAQ
jgi:predicted transposase YbfD/YdcC